MISFLKKYLPASIKKSRILRFFARLLSATYYNKNYIQILRWSVNSRENTNFTYDLTDMNIRYLASTLSIVTKKPYTIILSYIHEARNDIELKRHVIDMTKESANRYAADLRCDFGRRLGWYATARAIKPNIIIETGVDKGIGSVLLCSALIRNSDEGNEGFYYGTDINRRAGYLLAGKYREYGEIIYGDSIDSLNRFNRSIDLFINDSDHSAEYEYQEYLTIQKKLSPDAIILGDNSHVTDKLALFSIENGRQFVFFKEMPSNHWYPGGGIGISF